MWSVFINVQLEKEILLVIGTALNTKTNMGQPHSNWRPRESLADSPASAPAAQQSVNQHPLHLWAQPALDICTGSACSRQAPPAEGGSSLREGGRGMCTSGNEKRGEEMCSSTKGTCQWPRTAIPWAWWVSRCYFVRVSKVWVDLTCPLARFK